VQGVGVVIMPESIDKDVLKAYKEDILSNNEYKYLTSYPIIYNAMPYLEEFRLPIDKMYIPLRAIQKDESQRKKREQIKRIEDKRESLLKDSTKEIIKLISKQKYNQGFIHNLSEIYLDYDEVISEKLKENKGVIIFGLPGSGKSTLLRHLTRQIALSNEKNIPIYLSLKEYATYKGMNGKDSLLEFALNKISFDNGFLKEALSNSKDIFWLLDGLDETMGWSPEVAIQINKLPGRSIITARPMVHFSSNLDDYPSFEILPLNGDEIQKFISNFFNALAQCKEEKEEWIKRHISTLTEHLNKIERLKNLLSNPLLLTFLCILVYEKPLKKLPIRRFELYKEFVENLLNSWEYQRRPREGPEGKNIFKLGMLEDESARKAAISGFYYIGWYLHLIYHGGYSNDKPTKKFVSEKLSPLLIRDWKISQSDSEVLAQSIIQFWIDAGMLEVLRLDDEDYYEFNHYTFQEFASASIISELCCNHDDMTEEWKFISKKIHHYAWREPLFILLESLDPSKRRILLYKIFNNKSLFEREIHRDLILSTHLLIEGLVSDESLKFDIINRLGLLTKYHDTNMKKYLYYYSGNYIADRDLIISLLGKINERTAFNYLIDLLDDTELDGNAAQELTKDMFLQYVTECNLETQLKIKNKSETFRAMNLGNISNLRGNLEAAKLAYINAIEIEPKLATAWVGLGDAYLQIGKFSEAFDAYEKAIELPYYQPISFALSSKTDTQLIDSLKSEYKNERLNALRNLGYRGPCAVNHISGFINDPDTDIMEAAIQSLARIGNQQAISILVASLSNENEYARLEIRNALIKIESPDVIQYLTKALISDKNSIKVLIAEILGEKKDQEAIPALIVSLSDKDKDVITAIRNALIKIEGPDVIHYLTKALLSDKNSIKVLIAEILEERNDQEAIPALIESLSDEDNDVITAIRNALIKIEGPVVIQYLTKALLSDKNSIKILIAEILEERNDQKAIPALIASLSDEDKNVITAIRNALIKIEGPDVIQYLTKALISDKNSIKILIAEIFGERNDQEAIPALIASLSDEDKDVMTAIRNALIKIEGPDVIQYLTKALISDKNSIKVLIAEILGEKNYQEAIPALIASLSDEDRNVIAAIRNVLIKIEGPDVIHYLTKALISDKKSIKVLIAEILGERNDQEAIPALIESLSDEDNGVQFASRDALIEIIGYDTVQVLIRYLLAVNNLTKNIIANVLINKNKQEIIPTLITSLTSENNMIRLAVKETLVRMDCKEVIPLLADSLKCEDPQKKIIVIEILGEKGNKLANPSLARLLTDRDLNVRKAAIQAIGLIGNFEYIDDILKCLEDIDPEIKKQTINTLGKIGNKDAVLPLMKSLNESDPNIYKEAKKALRTIDDNQTEYEDQNIALYSINLLNSKNGDLIALALSLIEKSYSNLDDSKRIKKIAYALCKRLFDENNSSRNAFRILNKVANHLSVIFVEQMPFDDLLSHNAEASSNESLGDYIQIKPGAFGITININKIFGKFIEILNKALKRN